MPSIRFQIAQLQILKKYFDLTRFCMKYGMWIQVFIALLANLPVHFNSFKFPIKLLKDIFKKSKTDSQYIENNFFNQIVDEFESKRLILRSLLSLIFEGAISSCKIHHSIN